MISPNAGYALQVAVCLGKRAGTPCTVALLALETDAPPSYLAIVMNGLCRAGIVHSQGRLREFVLARDPSDLTVREVVSAVDTLRRLESCPLGPLAHRSGLCPLQRGLDNVLDAAQRSTELTIGQVLQEPGLLCRFFCIAEPIVDAYDRKLRRRKLRRRRMT